MRRHVKSMSPKLVLVAMLSCTTIIPSNIIFGLTVSALKYNWSEGLQSFLCRVSLQVITELISLNIDEKQTNKHLLVRKWRCRVIG